MIENIWSMSLSWIHVSWPKPIPTMTLCQTLFSWLALWWIPLLKGVSWGLDQGNWCNAFGILSFKTMSWLGLVCSGNMYSGKRTFMNDAAQIFEPPPLFGTKMLVYSEAFICTVYTIVTPPPILNCVTSMIQNCCKRYLGLVGNFSISAITNFWLQ